MADSVEWNLMSKQVSLEILEALDVLRNHPSQVEVHLCQQVPTCLSMKASAPLMSPITGAKNRMNSGAWSEFTL